jgi:predicted GIY-YIG superfamily endonuclease
MGAAGYAYLVHFAEPLGNPANSRAMARHYAGWSSTPERRMAAHAAARGARIMAAVERMGVPWFVVRTWPGSRAVERQLKRQRNAWRYCGICVEERGLERVADLDLEGIAELEAAVAEVEELDLERVADEVAELELERALEDEHWPAA